MISALPRGQLFFLFAGLLSFFFLWIFIFLPETKGVKLEDMHLVFDEKTVFYQRWKPVDFESYYSNQQNQNHLNNDSNNIAADRVSVVNIRNSSAKTFDFSNESLTPLENRK